MELVKLVAISFALLFIQACSHPIVIVGEGDILSGSGNRTCMLEEYQAELDNCSKNYVVGAYQETYYAVPRSGWQFDHWVTYCTRAPGNECSFDIAEDIVIHVWGKSMPPLQAVFTPIPSIDTDGDGLNDDVDPCPQNPINNCIPSTDTITIDGKVWAQPDLFNNLSWSELYAACQSGTCESGTLLNGYAMDGWTWAAIPDVLSLFTYFIGPGKIQLNGWPEDFYYFEYGSVWGPAFYSAGFRATRTNTYGSAAEGYTSSFVPIGGFPGQPTPPPQEGYSAFINDNFLDIYLDSVDARTEFDGEARPGIGAWFFRNP